MNKFIASKLDVPLVGCASHRFNLAANKLYAEFEPILEDVNSLMSQLRQPNNHAELSKHTELRPVKHNVVRWLSTFAMVERYLRIRAKVKKVEDVEELVPIGSRHRKLVALGGDLEKFNSTLKHLQRRTWIWHRCECCSTSSRPNTKAGAKIVHSPVFEAAVVKTINEQVLASVERKTLRPFETSETVAPKRKGRGNDYAAEILQARAKKQSQSTYSKLVPLIPPTSNTVERLFSQCQLIMIPQHSCMMPEIFETLSFLQANMGMWNAVTVAIVEDEITN
ncbi:hypothetical protein BBJ28_00013009 [Nothophytophthora sp. Chile5]|nr:hypothetical protein BBJ28_00013009 [Nothophytophthora sp. Chile5]